MGIVIIGRIKKKQRQNLEWLSRKKWNKVPALFTQSINQPTIGEHRRTQTLKQKQGAQVSRHTLVKVNFSWHACVSVSADQCSHVHVCSRT